MNDSTTIKTIKTKALATFRSKEILLRYEKPTHRRGIPNILQCLDMDIPGKGKYKSFTFIAAKLSTKYF